MIVVGVGALSAVQEIRDLVRGTEIPVLATYRAKGVVPDSWPEAAGLFTGAAVESSIPGEADLVLCIGLDAVGGDTSRLPAGAPVVALASWASSMATCPTISRSWETLPPSSDPRGGLLAPRWPAGTAKTYRGDIETALRTVGGSEGRGLHPFEVIGTRCRSIWGTGAKRP